MLTAIRVRGTVGVNRNIADTMDYLRLTRINHAVLIDENPSYNGMLIKAKDYITWGEITVDSITQLLTKRGRIAGGDKVTDEYIADNTNYSSIREFAQALYDSETTLADAKIKPVFRLHPPRKGYESTRLSYQEGGSLGYREDKIENLLKKML